MLTLLVNVFGMESLMSARSQELFKITDLIGKKRKIDFNLKFYRWWEWYGECTDTLGICNTNAHMQAKMSGGSLIQALE